MAFGIYVHIPYCLQRCVYCDFATYESDKILPPEAYVNRVKKEIALKSTSVGPRPLDTIYFGGGTPSLLEPELLLDIVKALTESGFTLKPDTEITLEINPATLDHIKIEKLLKGGFNRFSVGAQTFNDELLKKCHRRHSAQDTRETLGLFQKLGVNYSLDILFALPTQKLGDVQRDLEEGFRFEPKHVSPYCLTVPESNPLAANRAADETQVEMFDCIRDACEGAGLAQYEISNFARPGFESRHNQLYWSDDEYWGIGLSSHSYLHRGPYGTRFWNTRSIQDYTDEIDRCTTWQVETQTAECSERLLENQALTDYFHISLRRAVGLKRQDFTHKFGKPPEALAGAEIDRLKHRGLLKTTDAGYALTPQGIVLSNQVFEALTFLPRG